MRLLQQARHDKLMDPSTENLQAALELDSCELLLRNAAKELEDKEGMIKIFGLPVTFRLLGRLTVTLFGVLGSLVAKELYYS